MPQQSHTAQEKLAAFGLRVLKAHRGNEHIDGQDLTWWAEQAGALVLRQMNGPCGPNCICAAVGGSEAFPVPCHFPAADVQPLLKEIS